MGQAGRPPGPEALNRCITVADRDHQPTPGQDRRTVETTVRERILDSVARLGMSPSLAGKEAGVSAEVIWRYIRLGRAAEQCALQGQKLRAADQRLLDFLHDLDQARARYLADQMELHESFARGGLTTAEVTEEVDPTQPVVGDDGVSRPKVLNRKVKTKRLLPDPTAIRWNIERKSRAVEEAGVHFAGDEGLGSRQELTGAEGAPLDPPRSREEREAALLEEARAYLLGHQDGQAQAAEEKAAADG